MQMLKSLALGLVLSLLLGAGAVTAQSIRIVVVSHGQAHDPFWSVVKNGVDEAAKTMGVTVEYRAPDTFDMVRMSQLIDAAVASKPDGLVVSIPDASALANSIKGAVGAGIPVISMNSGSDVRKRLGALVHVGQTEFEAGLGGGEKMKAAGVKSALCVNQEVGNVALDLRCEGFAKGLGGKVQVVAVTMDPTETRNRIIATLSRNTDVDGILALGPTGSDPVLAALKETGALGKVKLGTFDLSPKVLEAVSKGEMLFAIDQQQFLQGYLPVVLLALHKKYGLIPGADVLTGPGFVVKENAAQVIDLSKKGIR